MERRPDSPARTAPRAERKESPDGEISIAARASLRRMAGKMTVSTEVPPPEPILPPQGRLVVVSNRVPVPTKSGAAAAGGLAVALEAALRRQGGLWFGWSGRAGEGRDSGRLYTQQDGNITFAVSDLAKRDFDEYYLGFSNRVLWPICHYRLDLMQLDRDEMAAYFRVNEQFARNLAPLLKPDDVVWIHDYHFIPMAATLRQMGVKNRIGFFLHIPWPPSDIASALPVFGRLMEAFTAYDLIGFQTLQDAENFANGLAREKLGRALGEGVYEAFGRSFRVGAFPIGIDTQVFAATARRAGRNALVQRMRASLVKRSLIIGVDRLDYSKGVKERIEAFSCFLRGHPEFHNKVTFLQITPKSRSEVPEYQKMQHEIAEQAGWANGTFGEVDWVPVRYVNQTVGHGALAGLYRMARVGLVTPLRDGMNLVAKEFVAAQREDDPGVLILSRFAGAAQELDSALLVNPYDTEATAAAIARALEMPLAERKERWTAMMAQLDANSVSAWSATFLRDLAALPQPASAAAFQGAPSP